MKEIKFLNDYTKLINKEDHDIVLDHGEALTAPQQLGGIINNIDQPFEPMTQNRFLVVFPENLQISSSFVRSTSRPKIYFNDTGGYNWGDLDFVFYDPIAPSLQRVLFDYINSSNLLNHNLEIKIQMIDPIGSIVSEWVVFGFIKQIDFGNLDYNSYELTETRMVFAVDYGFLNF